MVCYYVELCKKCGGGRKWLCGASIPPKRIKDRNFCRDPVKNECPIYGVMVEKHGVKERTDGL